MVDATTIVRTVERARIFQWCNRHRGLSLIGAVLLLYAWNWLSGDYTSDPNGPDDIDRAEALAIAGPMKAREPEPQGGANVPAIVDLSQKTTEHHAHAGQSISEFKVYSSDYPHNLSAEKQRAFEMSAAAWARHYNRRLRTIAENDLPFASEILEIRNPVWGFMKPNESPESVFIWEKRTTPAEGNMLVGTSAVTYRTDEGKMLVAFAFWEGGKWRISQSDDFNLMPTADSNADLLMQLWYLHLSPKLDVPD